MEWVGEQDILHATENISLTQMWATVLLCIVLCRVRYGMEIVIVNVHQCCSYVLSWCIYVLQEWKLPWSFRDFPMLLLPTSLWLLLFTCCGCHYHSKWVMWCVVTNYHVEILFPQGMQGGEREWIHNMPNDDTFPTRDYQYHWLYLTRWDYP